MLPYAVLGLGANNWTVFFANINLNSSSQDSRLVLYEYGCGLFTCTYRLRGNARSSPGSRCTLKLDMYDRRKIQIRTLPSLWAQTYQGARGRHIARAGGLNT